MSLHEDIQTEKNIFNSNYLINIENFKDNDDDLSNINDIIKNVSNVRLFEQNALDAVEDEENLVEHVAKKKKSNDQIILNNEDEIKILNWSEICDTSQLHEANEFVLPNNNEVLSLLNIPQDNVHEIIIIENMTVNNETTNLPAIDNDNHCKSANSDTCTEEKILNDSPFSEVLYHPCMKQLETNNLHLQQFIKNKIKPDIKMPANITNSREKGNHECNLCERVFVHASGLKRHLDKHSKDTIPNIKVKPTISSQAITSCLICGRVFTSAKTALEHINVDHFDPDKDDEYDTVLENATHKNEQDQTYASNNENDCNQTDDVSNMADHFKAIIIPLVLQCEFCEYMFDNVNHLLNHEATHDPINGYECQMCEIKGLSASNIHLHWQTECAFMNSLHSPQVNVDKLFVCNICLEAFQSLNLLYTHRYTLCHLFPRQNHLNPDSFLINCEVCSSIHNSAQSFVLHYNESHKKKMKYRKPEPSNKTRPFLCDVCGKSYTQSSHLWQHLRFHKGVKPFSCSIEGCNRKFTIRPDLNDHIRKCHTGERPYHCLECGKRFLTGSVYYQHRLIHRGERRYECADCGKKFYRADALKNHSRIHTGEKPYPCEYCPKAFRQRGDKDKHVKARHYALVNNTLVRNRMVTTTKVSSKERARPTTKKSKKNIENVPDETDDYVGLPQSIYDPIAIDSTYY